MKVFYKLPELNYDSCVWFNGTDNEIEEAEEQDNYLETCWKHIINDARILTLQFVNNVGHIVILSKSLYHKDEAIWQLSYFDERGAIMHQSYSFLEINGDDYSSFSTLLFTLCQEATHGQTVCALSEI